MGGIPYQCPKCGESGVTARSVPPDRHDRGDDWCTRVDCPSCEYEEWAE